MRRSAEGRTKH